MLPYLKQCVYSISDQQVDHEHIVIDGNSSDGTKLWLNGMPNLKWISEKDNGMYDALNKGLSMAQGEIIAHLNADEQYLEGSLNYIIDFFDKNPEVDYVVADFLLVDKDGKLISCRKSFPPFWPFFFSNYLYTFTCTLFYRKKVVEMLKYNDQYKSIADVDFFYNIQRRKFKGVHLRKFVAAFTYTGNNLSVHPISHLERKEYENSILPKWFKFTKSLLKLAFHSTRLIYGCFWHYNSFNYELYTQDSLAYRKKIMVKNPSCRWVQ